MRNRILIVDDDASVRNSMRSVLLNAGYQVFEAGEGERALALLQAGVFDLLLLDIELPNVSGWDLLEHISSTHPLLPKIILTSYAAQCEPGATDSADFILEKPVDVPSFLKAVERLLREGSIRCERSSSLASGIPGYLRLASMSNARRFKGSGV